MRRLRGIIFGAITALLAVAANGSASAMVTYRYEGSPFTTFFGATSCPPVCNLSGYFTVATPLAPDLSSMMITPVSFSFTDGLNVIDSTNYIPFGPFGPTQFEINTDSTGQIIGWVEQIISNLNFMLSAGGNVGLALDTTSNNSGTLGAGVFGTPGVWTESVNAPEPMTLTLFGTGLSLLAFAAYRRRARS